MIIAKGTGQAREIMKAAAIVISIGAAYCGSASAATLILEEGVNGYAGTRDTTLFQDRPAHSSGGFPNFFSSVTQTASPRRTLLKFDIPTTFPVGSTITGVALTLTMDQTRPGNITHTLHRVTKAWNEGNNPLVDSGTIGLGAPAQPGDATWTHTSYNTITWTTSGGDYAASPSASAPVGTAPGTVTFSSAQMTTDTLAWQATPSTNLGWVLIGDESTVHTAKRFVSSEGTAGSRPRLTITYTPPVTAASDWQMLD